MVDKIKWLTPKEAVQAAMTLVYEDFEAYVKDIAREHTIANLGQELEDHCGSHNRDGKHVISSGFQQLREDCGETDESLQCVDDEYRSWLKEARKDAEKVRSAGLPLTIENSRLAFLKQGPFARPKGQKPAKR